MTYTRQQARSNHAQDVLESPIFVTVRKSSGVEVAWARVDSPNALQVLRYVPVRPDEVEELQGGQYAPSKKDIGMYFIPDKKANIVRVGELMLMKVTAEDKAARLKRENERALGIRPKRTDVEAETEEETEQEVKLGDEVEAIQKGG